MDMRRRLAETAAERGTILCFGIDPDLARIAPAMPGSEVSLIEPFFREIIDRLLAENAIAALKPNYAYFAQYGFDGLYVLEELMQKYRNAVPIILDAKRGDIGKSSEAYAREAYEFWGADAVTVSPYMGEDSVKPFVREGKLAYVLCRTSNDGAKDFQQVKCGRKSVYELVSEKAVKWKCGLVVGATSTAIATLAKTTRNAVPFLIPGVGAQGGDLEAVMKAVKANPAIHRVNASSSLSYAYEKAGGKPADAALREAGKLTAVMRKYLQP